MQTIVALATPAGNAGVSVIRISGEQAKPVLQKLIRKKLDFEPRKMYLESVFAGEVEDKCLVVFFAAPNSFTGEDVAEIQSHGGYVLAQAIIDECIRQGAVMATPGEFSKRAFLNGKISVDQAEGIMDLINAESKAQLEAGSNLLVGKLTKKITDLQNELTDILAEIEAKLDYPEYDFEESEESKIKAKLSKVLDEMNQLINESKNGLIIKNGVRVALVGAPNVGKSSLLNALTQSEKAIVTDIAGTTRDIVEAEYEYKGIVFRLFDTAGIHESSDVVEKIGIDRAIKTLQTADLVLKVSDNLNICDIETDKPYIDVFNKSDLVKNVDKKYFVVSAKNNVNIDKLKEEIFKKTVSKNIDATKLYLTNARHIECVRRAILCVENAIEIFAFTSMDIISAQIRTAWNALGEITGVNTNEEIISRIFSKFCLGK